MENYSHPGEISKESLETSKGSFLLFVERCCSSDETFEDCLYLCEGFKSESKDKTHPFNYRDMVFIDEEAAPWIVEELTRIFKLDEKKEHK